MALLQRAKKAKAMSEVEKARELNSLWILNNRNELLDNFSSKWVAVDNESIQLADNDPFVLYRAMRNRGSADTVVYFYVNTFEPPLILHTPVKLEYEWSEEAGWYA